MPVWLIVVSLLVTIGLTIMFLILFFKEWKNGSPNNYPDRSIRKFLKSTALTFYLLFATVTGLSVISIITLITI